VFGGECATTDLSHDDSLYLLNTCMSILDALM
jgi:hypothetical protein